MNKRTKTIRGICLCVIMLTAWGCSRSTSSPDSSSPEGTAASSSDPVSEPEKRQAVAGDAVAGDAVRTSPATPASLRSATLDASAKGSASATVEVDGLANQRYRPHLQAEIRHIEPSEEWASEAFSEAASSQLKKLAGWLSDHAAAHDDLSDWIDASAIAASLAPEMTPVLQDETVTVKRWYEEAGGQDASTQPLRDEFVRLRDHFSSDSTVRWEFKVVEVQLDEASQTATTDLYVEAYSRGNAREKQYNAQWKCEWTVSQKESPRLKAVHLSSANELETMASQWQFQDVTKQVFGGGSIFTQQLQPGTDYWRRRIDWRFGAEVVGAHGLAVADVNGDGLEDVYLCEPGGLPNRLLLQQSDGTVRDVSHEAGVDFLEPTHSALFVDFDNDGDADLVLASGRYLLFLENAGRARFQVRKIHESNSVFRSLAAADYDGDRLVDVYACGYFLRDGTKDGVGLGRPLPYHDANNGAPNSLIANRGDWRFEDVTEAVGLNENNTRFSYACGWADFDRDGDLDLYVANDFGRNNLYRHDRDERGRTTFRDVAGEAGVEDISAGMSVSWSDFDRDGWLDLYVGNMYSSAGNRVAYQRQYLPGGDESQKALYQRHARGNSLFQNTGQGNFRDLSLAAGVNMARWAWSSNFVDLNNDGWDDLVVANGMVTGQEDPGDL